MKAVQEEILKCWDVVAIDLLERTYMALCTGNSQEHPEDLKTTILAEKREIIQIQVVQNSFGRETCLEAQLYRTAVCSANFLTEFSLMKCYDTWVKAHSEFI